MKTLARFFFALTVSLLYTCVYAQQAATPSAQDQADIDKFIQELLPKLAAASGEKEAKVKLLIVVEKEAANYSKRITAEKEKAARESANAEQAEMLMKSRISRQGGAQAMNTAAYEGYESSIQAAAAAKASLRNLTEQEDEAKKTHDAAQRALENARQERDAKEATRTEQREKLSKLYGVWKENKTEENFKALTGQLTAMAAAANETSDVELVTQNPNKQPTKGALIYYESELDRKNKVQPIKSSSCTTGCVEKSMPKGWYYMWSVRGNRETSDKNRYLHIVGPTDRKEIIENN